MCRVILVVGTLLAIPLGASLEGQTTSPIESELADRVDSLSVILRRADDAARLADAVRTEERRRLLTARIDTFSVGPFLVVTPVEQSNLARRYFEQAWGHYAAIVGTERTSIEGHIFIFSHRQALLGLDARGATRVTTRFMPRDRERAIGRILGGFITNDLPDDLRTWVGDFFIGADPTIGLEWAYRSLVTTASAAVTDCYDGVLARCWDALGLDHQDEWATAWYTASERRTMVDRMAPSPNPGVQGLRASCVDDQRNDACLALLVDSDAAASIPLPLGTRMTLVAHALSLGGPEGYRRLISDTEGPIKNRLARASGVSADSLIASWRATTFKTRPNAYGDTRRTRWSSLMWLLVLAGVSTRSTRWRLT